MFPALSDMESCFSRAMGGGGQTEVGQRKEWEVQKRRQLVEPALSRNLAPKKKGDKAAGGGVGLEEGLCCC